MRKRWTTADGKRLYGIMAEFDSPEKLIHAAETAHAAEHCAPSCSSSPVTRLGA